MTYPDLTAEQRRLAIAQSVAEIRPDDAEPRIREFLERSGGALNEWDQKFLELVRSPDAGRLFHASAGEGIEVYFSPSSGKGLWLIKQPSLLGKGLLSAQDVERLAAAVSDARPPAA